MKKRVKLENSEEEGTKSILTQNKEINDFIVTEDTQIKQFFSQIAETGGFSLNSSARPLEANF